MKFMCSLRENGDATMVEADDLEYAIEEFLGVDDEHGHAADIVGTVHLGEQVFVHVWVSSAGHPVERHAVSLMSEVRYSIELVPEQEMADATWTATTPSEPADTDSDTDTDPNSTTTATAGGVA